MGAAIAYTVGHTGLRILGNLAEAAGDACMRRWWSSSLACCCRSRCCSACPLKRFIKAVAEPATIAFGTTSSEAALPRAMERWRRLGVPRQIVAFVIPTGYSFNLDGSSLYLSVAAIFVAQVAGIHLSLGPAVDDRVHPDAHQQRRRRAFRARRWSSCWRRRRPSDCRPSRCSCCWGSINCSTWADGGECDWNCLATVVMAKWEGEFRTEQPSPVVVEAASS